MKYPFEFPHRMCDREMCRNFQNWRVRGNSLDISFLRRISESQSYVQKTNIYVEYFETIE